MYAISRYLNWHHAPLPRLHLIRTVPYNFVLKNTNLSSAATIEQISNWVSHSLHQEEKLCTDFNKIDIKEENTIELIRNKQRAEGKVTRAGVWRSSSWWRRPVGDGGGGGVRVPLVAGNPHGPRRLPQPRSAPSSTPGSQLPQCAADVGGRAVLWCVARRQRPVAEQEQQQGRRRRMSLL